MSHLIEPSRVKVGTSIIWNQATPPDGYLEENGAAISRTTYAELFAEIGTTYGVGDGSTTFNLPNKQGEFLRGWDNTAGNDPDAASRTDRGDGTTGDNIGTKQGGQNESHSHITSENQTLLYAGGGGNANTRNGNYPGGNEYTTSTAGGNEARPRNVNVMYCIKY